MHLMDNKLPGDATSLRIVKQIIGHPGIEYQYNYWDTLDMIYSLQAGFIWTYSDQRCGSGLQADFSLRNILDAINNQADAFEKLGPLENEFEVRWKSVQN
jgi:hypothetical protein